MVDEAAVWLECELAWVTWLRSNNYDSVTYLGSAEGNTRRSEAPLMAVGGVDVRAPDVITTRQGKQEYWEVKYRARPMLDHETGEYEHWMPYAAFDDYTGISQRTGSPVHIVLYEAATATEAGRWLMAEVQEVLDHGKRMRRFAHDGREIDAWVWRRRAMKLIAGPNLAGSARTPLLPVEGGGDPVSPADLVPAERSLRARRRDAGSRATSTPVTQAERLLEEDPTVALDVLRLRLGIDKLPRYSVWWSHPKESDIDDILALIDYGIRVYLVLPTSRGALQTREAAALRAAGLLQLAVVPSAPTYCIVDGQVPEDPRIIEAMATVDSVGGINVEQFRIIHAAPHADVAVLAGAGTGKTETMAERIVFLLATVKDMPSQAQAGSARLDQIALVTFTREAAREMRERIARTLLLRRRLCKTNTLPTLAWMLQLASTQISTIHAFARSLVGSFGDSVGIAPNFSITSRNKEFRNVLATELSDALEDLAESDLSPSLPAAYEWYRHIIAVHEHLENNGLATSELEWGQHADPLTAEAQELLSEGLKALRIYSENRAKADQALRLAELIPAAARAIRCAPPANEAPRFLFVDEFQDTDLGQLELFSALRSVFGTRMFVVGDVKQGIYRFRGAAGDAFDELDAQLVDVGEDPTVRLTLTRNFRSAPKLLEQLHRRFAAWGAAQLLEYGPSDQLRPGIEDSPASLHVTRVGSPGDYARDAAAIVQEWRRESPDESLGIVCRRNAEALAVQTAIRRLGMTCDIAVGGLFFLSPAVRELLTLLQAVADPTNAALVAQVTETRWSAGILRERTPFNLGPVPVGPWSQPEASLARWSHRITSLAHSNHLDRADLTELRDRLMTLRRSAMFMAPLQFVSECIAAFDPVACAKPTDDESERPRYARCLDHLVALLDATFPDGGGSLWELIDWLEQSIALNRSEDEPIPSDVDAGTTIALTVHKAKGLQYDRVLVPRTWIEFGPPATATTEVVLAQSANGTRVGWLWRASDREFSTIDSSLESHESSETAKEETRLLYVAMTRAKRHLHLLVRSQRTGGPVSPRSRTWEDLLVGSTR